MCTDENPTFYVLFQNACILSFIFLFFFISTELHDAGTAVRDRSQIGVNSHNVDEPPEKDQTPGPLEPDSKRATVHHREKPRTVPGKGQVNRIVRKEGNRPHVRNYNIRD